MAQSDFAPSVEQHTRDKNSYIDITRFFTEWTKSTKGKINKEKTNTMIFNFSKDHQFTTRLSIEDQNIDVVNEKKLLGTIITNDLKFNKNTDFLVKKAYARMEILRKLENFSNFLPDLKLIYISYIRSVLEINCTVWNSALNEKNINDLERVQKCALRIMLKDKYISYEKALLKTDLEKLNIRRRYLC